MEDNDRKTLIQFVANTWTEDYNRLLQLLFSLSLEEERYDSWKASNIWKIAHRMAVVQWKPEEASLFLKDALPFKTSDLYIQLGASCEEIWEKKSCESMEDGKTFELVRPGSRGLLVSLNCLRSYHQKKLYKIIREIYDILHPDLTVAVYHDISSPPDYLDKLEELLRDSETVKVAGAVTGAAVVGCIGGIILGLAAPVAIGLFVGGNALGFAGMYAYDRWNTRGERNDLNDGYKYLGVTSTADQKEIDMAFKRLSTTLHPDKGGSNEEFQKLVYYRNLLLEKCP